MRRASQYILFFQASNVTNRPNTNILSPSCPYLSILYEDGDMDNLQWLQKLNSFVLPITTYIVLGSGILSENPTQAHKFV